MKKYKKRLGACMALLLVVVIGVCALVNHMQSSYAQETFTQVGDLVTDKVQNGQDLTILEIVDSLEEASIGYLVGGQEPYVLNANSMSNADLLADLRAKGLLSPNDTDDQASYPLTHTPGEGEEWDPDPESGRLLSDGYQRVRGNDGVKTVEGHYEPQTTEGVNGYSYLTLEEIESKSNNELAELLLQRYTGEEYRTSGNIVAYRFYPNDNYSISGNNAQSAFDATVDELPGDEEAGDEIGNVENGDNSINGDSSVNGQDNDGNVENSEEDNHSEEQSIPSDNGTEQGEESNDSASRAITIDTQSGALLASAEDAIGFSAPESESGASDTQPEWDGQPNVEDSEPLADEPESPADETESPDADNENGADNNTANDNNVNDGNATDDGGQQEDTAPPQSDMPELAEPEVGPDIETIDVPMPYAGIESASNVAGLGNIYKYSKETLENNEWFKTYVLGLEPGTNNFNNLNIRVLTFTPDGSQTLQFDGDIVTNISLTDALGMADLVYINGDGLVNGSATPANRDLSPAFVQTLLRKVANEKFPVIVNYREYVLDNVHENMRKLVTMLLQADLATAYNRLTFNDASTEVGKVRYTDAFSSDGWQEMAAGVKVENGGNFVRESIFCVGYRYQGLDFDPSTYKNNTIAVDIMELVNADFNSRYTNDATDAGFSKVYSAILQENYERGQSGSGRASMPEYVTPAVAVSYILNFKGYDPIIYKDTIRVLELEPCRDYTYYYDGDLSTEAGQQEMLARKRLFAHNWAPAFEENLDAITIDGMTTSEFCGKISDVYELYDVIYFGSNTGVLNTITEDTWVKADSNYTAENFSVGDWSTGNGVYWYYNAAEQAWYEYKDVTNWGSNPLGGTLSDTPGEGPSSDWYNNNGTTWDNSSSTWCWSGTDHCWKVRATLKFTAYNDPEMIGIVYAHTGDIYHGDQRGTELEREPEDADARFRSSGNDILRVQVQELIDFLKSGSPIILASDFVTEDENGKIVANSSGYTQTIQTWKVGSGGTAEVHGILDNSSYVFAFVAQALQEEYENLLIDGQADAVSMAAALNQQKMTLNVLSVPTPYAYTESADELGSIVDITYLSKESDGNYWLNYEFVITNLSAVTPLTTRYDVKLYLDANSDGIYNTATEEIADIEVYNAQTGELISRVGGPMEEGGEDVLHYELSANTPYIVRRILPQGYVGCIGWKLKSTQVGNTFIHDSVTGITAVRNDQQYGGEIDPETGKQIIHILQITSQQWGGGGNTLDLEWEYEKNADTSQWVTLMDSIPDFAVDFDSIWIQDFAYSFEYGDDPNAVPPGASENYYYDPRNAEGAGGYLTGFEIMNWEWNTSDPHWNPDSRYRKDYLNFWDYDMVVVGFADNYMNMPSQRATEAMVAYGDSGKSVMYTHDLTSWYQGATDFSSTETSNTFSRSIRAQSGLDRYGVTVDVFTDAYANNPINDGVDGQTAAYIAAYNESVGRYNSDIAYLPNTGQSIMAPQTEAMTYMKMSGGQWRPFRNDLWGSGSWLLSYGANHSRVGQVNTGIITQYPYLIEEEMATSNTHGQYYQVDLDTDSDGDGRGDVTVWYCINSLQPDEDWNDVFDLSPNDVRNNYYIYSKGNIFYTGVGHDRNHTIEEMKLFINTFVAAYSAGIRNPEVRIVDGPSDNAPDLEVVSFPFDASTPEEAGTYRVYYQVRDTNLTQGVKELSVQYFVVDPAGGNESTVRVAAEEIAAHRFADEELVTHLALTDAVVPFNQILSGYTYYVDVPLRYLLGTEDFDPESFDFYVEIDLRIDGTNDVVAWDSDKLTIMEIKLFDLD